MNSARLTVNRPARAQARASRGLLRSLRARCVAAARVFWLAASLATCLHCAAATAPAEDSSTYRLTPWPAGTPSPGFTLRDASGHRRTLGDYRGRPVVVFFGFLHCPDACPTELYKLAQVIHALGPVPHAPQILFITLDPERDAPAQLASYVTSFNPAFVGLTGSAQQIQRAADSFGVQFARVVQGADYTIDHSTATYIFDGHGQLRLVAPLSASAADLRHDLQALERESAG